ncbi:MAG TPA: nicotinate-nucleotide--dimethylbenzimidazole phosphoribosyltransferase [Candidatus Dormibacteraeota bacterium]|nr:nicotinate-nucleotide--dimethylbenzimidazole phosphoribosyltransferase [Candidatus Dormibacteraeota bacterium]
MPVPPLDHDAMRAAADRQARLTKPAGSLGRLEELSVRLAGMTGSLDPPLDRAVIFTLAADHGVSAEGVSAYPREVTPQMVLNFLRGGAAINVLARAVGARVVVADLGVDADLPSHPELRAIKVRRGTASITRGPAMSEAEARRAVDAGRQLVLDEDPDVVLTGDMGIGNTTASAALVCALTGLEPALVVGRGTGVDEEGLRRKQSAVSRALDVNRDAVARGPLAALASVGGLEIAGLVGVILQAAEMRRPAIIDGFISGAAALTAAAIDQGAPDYMVASHRSHELGHRVVLERLGLQPLLDLDMRLGEGTGAALALPLVRAAVRLLNDMATFGEAGVSERA